MFIGLITVINLIFALLPWARKYVSELGPPKKNVNISDQVSIFISSMTSFFCDGEDDPTQCKFL